MGLLDSSDEDSSSSECSNDFSRPTSQDGPEDSPVLAEPDDEPGSPERPRLSVRLSRGEQTPLKDQMDVLQEKVDQLTSTVGSIASSVKSMPIYFIADESPPGSPRSPHSEMSHALTYPGASFDDRLEYGTVESEEEEDAFFRKDSEDAPQGPGYSPPRNPIAPNSSSPQEKSENKSPEPRGKPRLRRPRQKPRRNPIQVYMVPAKRQDARGNRVRVPYFIRRDRRRQGQQQGSTAMKTRSGKTIVIEEKPQPRRDILGHPRRKKIFKSSRDDSKDGQLNLRSLAEGMSNLEGKGAS